MSTNDYPVIDTGDGWINDFIRNCFPYKKSSSNYIEGIKIKNNHTPRTIFKHTRIMKYTFESIRNGSIHFANPATFNDPFDFFARYNFQNPSKEWYDRIFSIMEANQSIRDDLKFEDRFKEIERSIDVRKLLDNPKAFMQERHYAQDGTEITQEDILKFCILDYCNSQDGLVELNMSQEDLVNRALKAVLSVLRDCIRVSCGGVPPIVEM